MSENEKTSKAAEVGELALRAASQKEELVYLQRRFQAVRQAYAAIAVQGDRLCVDPARPNTVYLRFPEPEERSLPGLLLNQEELAKLLLQLNDVQAALDTSRARLAAYGITCV